MNPAHIAHLKRRDPKLGKIIAQVTIQEPKGKRDHFRSLVDAIVSQQLSVKASETILNRFIALFPKKKFPSPEDILKMRATKIRKAGLSNMKVAFLKDLSKRIVDGSLNLKALDRLPDEEVIVRLVEVKGIGRWTAEMFLMFSLRRPDVFSYGDLGLKNAMKDIYKLRAHPSEKTAEKISAKWRPHRTLASRYLWASLDLKKKKK